MKTTLQKVRDGIAAVLLGKTPEEFAEEQLRENLKKTVSNFLACNPDWKPSDRTDVPVTNIKQKTTEIKKAGAGTFTPHVVDEEALRRACEAARAFQAADPERYSHIIGSAPIKGRTHFNAQC